MKKKIIKKGFQMPKEKKEEIKETKEEKKNPNVILDPIIIEEKLNDKNNG